MNSVFVHIKIWELLVETFINNNVGARRLKGGKLLIYALAKTT
jgi:hypothetical protein